MIDDSKDYLNNSKAETIKKNQVDQCDQQQVENNPILKAFDGGENVYKPLFITVDINGVDNSDKTFLNSINKDFTVDQLNKLLETNAKNYGELITKSRMKHDKKKKCCPFVKNTLYKTMKNIIQCILTIIASLLNLYIIVWFFDIISSAYYPFNPVILLFFSILCLAYLIYFCVVGYYKYHLSEEYKISILDILIFFIVFPFLYYFFLSNIFIIFKDYT